MNKLIALGVSFVSMIVLGGSAAAAGTAVLSLSPASGTYNTGKTLTAGISENGTDVNVVTVSITYDASKLQFVSAHCGGSFPNTIIAASSTPKFTCSVTPGSPAVSGNVQVGSVSFKVVATGSTSVSFAADTQVASNGINIWNGTPTGGTYSRSTPPKTTPPPTTHPSSGAPTTVTTSGSVLGATASKGTPTSKKTDTTTKQSTPVVTQSKPITIAKTSSVNFTFGLVIAALVVIAVAFAVGIFYEKILAFVKNAQKSVYKSAPSAAKKVTKKTRKPAAASAK